jgi:hypothetical protein
MILDFIGLKDPRMNLSKEIRIVSVSKKSNVE